MPTISSIKNDSVKCLCIKFIQPYLKATSVLPLSDKEAGKNRSAGLEMRQVKKIRQVSSFVF